MVIKYLKNLACLALSVLILGCNHGGQCANCTKTTPSSLTLTLTAPLQYPAVIATTAYLTMTNTSNTNATNLFYAIPTSTNYTGTTITVSNGSANPCLNIPAGKSCTFPVQIAAGSHPGSFAVTATSNATQALPKNSAMTTQTKPNLNATLTLNANIGLTALTTNPNDGANGITFLYSQTIAANISGATVISIVGVVNSATAGAFNAINLSDSHGNLLNFSVVSGNSGSGLTNLSNGSVVTFLLTIPAGASSYQFYGQTLENGTLVAQGTIANPINLSTTTQGVLVVQPTNANLSAPNYETQVLTYTNTGYGMVTNLVMPTPTAPLTKVANTCGPSLAAGASCNYTIGSTAAAGTSGSVPFTATYNNGSATATTTTQLTYAGLNPLSGLQLASGDNPSLTFTTNTVNGSVSSQLTLLNSGNVSESNFVITLPSYFGLSAGSGDNSCALSGNTVTTVLATHGASCNLTLTYTNASATAQTSANLTINYFFNGAAAPQATVALTYQTIQAVGLLQVTSPILPYTFPSIRSNSGESATQVFVITNVGNGPASNLNNGSIVPVVNPTLLLPGKQESYFTLIPSSPAPDQCGTGKQSLAVAESCLMTVRFGPSGSVGNLLRAPAPTPRANLLLSYESYPSSATATVAARIQGTILPALSAKPQITSIIYTPTPVAGDGFSESTPFAIESSNNPATATLTYQNLGTYAATNFTVASDSLTTYSVTSNNCNGVSLAINASCTVVLSLPITSAGNPNLNLMELLMSWQDQSGIRSGVYSSWNNGSYLVYVDIFGAPRVTAIMSSNPQGTMPISGNVDESSTFYIVYSLSGGYQVESMSYALNLNCAAGGTPRMSITGVPSCTISSQQTSCSLQLNAGGMAMNQKIIYTTSGAVAPTPLNVTFNVNSPV